jgi:hypothetical protein
MATLNTHDQAVLVTFGLALHTSWLTESNEKLRENGYLRVKKGDGMHSMVVTRTKKGDAAAERWLPKLARQELATLSEEALEALIAREPNEELEATMLGFVPAGRKSRFVPNELGRAVIALAEKEQEDG